jgi:hypothetical protein
MTGIYQVCEGWKASGETCSSTTFISRTRVLVLLLTNPKKKELDPSEDIVALDVQPRELSKMKLQIRLWLQNISNQFHFHGVL